MPRRSESIVGLGVCNGHIESGVVVKIVYNKRLWRVANGKIFGVLERPYGRCPGQPHLPAPWLATTTSTWVSPFRSTSTTAAGLVPTEMVSASWKAVAYFVIPQEYGEGVRAAICCHQIKDTVSPLTSPLAKARRVSHREIVRDIQGDRHHSTDLGGAIVNVQRESIARYSRNGHRPKTAIRRNWRCG